MANWNEADHPRDEDGKFTYKNGGETTLYGGVEETVERESPADILYKNSTEKENNGKYRNKLLSILGNILKSEEVLYSSVPELENKIIKSEINKLTNLKVKLQNVIPEIQHKGNLKEKAVNISRALNYYESNYARMIDENIKNSKNNNYSGKQNGYGAKVMSKVINISDESEKEIINLSYERLPDNPFKTVNYELSNKNGKNGVNITQTEKQKSISESHKSYAKNWIMPCKGRIVGVFGEQRKTHIHNGIDIAVPIGTPLKAVADGKIIQAGPAHGYGNFVVIEHVINGKIVTSEYGHIKSWTVKKGQYIKQGQIIAYSGNEGYSQGPHCHLTIREGFYKGKAVNPNKYIQN